MSLENSPGLGDNRPARKPWALIFLGFTLAMILVLRLFYIQVLRYEGYLTQSEHIRITREVIEAPRGFIYDRNGEVLAENRMSYSITADPFDRAEFDESIPRLAALVPELPALINAGGDGSLVDAVKRKIGSYNNPVKIVRDADFRLLSIVEEHSNELPGIGGVFEQRRNYPQGPLAAHVIGYMGEPTATEYDVLKDKGYELGQTIGKHGVEKYYESTLKGTNGARFVERDYLSRNIGTTSEFQPVYPVPGENIRLTLDMRLQAVAQEAFADTTIGALIALDPRNGEILVMASAPSFDPNDFTHVMTSDQYSGLVNDPDKPMFNRAIQATYPPGSTFKVVTAITGMENGIPPTTTFQPCNGAYYFGRWYHCWDENGHGVLDMEGALEHSCNVYFYQLSRRLDLEEWHQIGDDLGLGQKTGIDIDGEVAGILPDYDYYKRTGVAWSPGMILNLSIGQGENLATILQLAHYMGIVATEGIDATPHLVRGEIEPPRRVMDIDPSSFKVAKRGMMKVVHGSGGSAKSARIPGHVIAGKTGTAQNPHGEAHKLFVAFAPYDDPAVVVACVAENADGLPVSLAVQIVRKVLISYFNYYDDPTVVAVND